MPVKLGSKLPGEAEARIEIIPLIDIMFFLLAAFMLVSLSMTRLQSVRVDLPTATASTPADQREFVNISVDAGGLAYLDRQPLAFHELAGKLAGLLAANPGLRVIISGDRAARHGDVIQVLDLVRGAGIEQVAFEIREPAATPSP